MRPLRHLLLASAVSFALVASSHASVTPDGRVRFLTGPQQGAADALAIDYLVSQRAALGLTAADIADMQLRDDYVSTRSGIRHLYWRQRHEGIGVWNGDLGINVARDGSIINLHHAFVPDLAGKVARTTPTVDARDAILSAASGLGLQMRVPMQLLRSDGGPSRKAVYSGAGISADDIAVELVYQPSFDRSSVRLAWDFAIRTTDGENWWSLRVDAETGELLSDTSFIAHAGQANAKATLGSTTHSYRVFPYPFENPDQTAHALVNNPHDSLASPFAWHDTNGAAGDEFTDTRGNNVNAQDDIDANNTGGTRPTGSPTSPLTFDIPWSAANQPNGGTNLNAAIVNLFYWNNIMHDVTYQYGFDEAGGNFQVNNYGRGGAANDAVNADALDGLNTGSRGNANFGTPPDGSPPRMQMFLWHAPLELVVNTPAGIAGTYLAVLGNFGPAVTTTGVTADVQLVNDGVAGVPTPPNPPGTVNDGCEAAGMPAGSLTGKIALVERGFCTFVVKAANVQAAGAVGMMVQNNVAGPPAGMGGTAPAVTIPSFMIAQADGTTIRGQLPSPGVNATIRATQINRDSDMDAGIIAHEYGHGVSNRLTGGPANSSCLLTEPNGAGNGFSEQAGEGWSDFWTLVLHAKPGDTATTSRFIGTYSAFQSGATGPGIRNFPYSTDTMASPQTYANVATTNAPHGVGEIWAGALWNLYWNLVGQYGYDPNKYTGTGGNNLLMQLVVDGMKLQPCSPTMVAARDAILLADQNSNAGANRCHIWNAFAAKGLGTNAIAGTFMRGDETAGFNVPVECTAEFVFADGFED
jgi:hypothetical protein